MSRVLWIVTLLAGCGGGMRRVRDTTELPAGSCKTMKLEPGDRCEERARDYSIGTTVSVPKDHADQVGGNVWVRWPLFHAGLDERHLRKGDRSYRSIAGMIGTQLRPLIFYPHVQRHVDLVIHGGFELGALYDDNEGRIKGRGAGYVGTAVDLFPPDFASLRYQCSGLPGVRIGVRYTAFVLGWESDVTFELGLIWRWGVPIDLHTTWTYRRSGD